MLLKIYCLPTICRAKYTLFFTVILFMLLLGGCASTKRRGSEPLRPLAPAARPGKPQKPSEPEIPLAIMGRGSVSGETLAEFLLQHNPALGAPFAKAFAAYYIEEGAVEGVNPDVAFSQMCVETGYLSFAGQVTPDMNNFAGIGTTGPGVKGEKFETPRIGVRAQIQHLKAYASEEPLKGALVDPRYRWVRYGSAPTIADLAGKWAADREYGEKIKGVLTRLYTYASTSAGA
jgi:hypothetical protein